MNPTTPNPKSGLIGQQTSPHLTLAMLTFMLALIFFSAAQPTFAEGPTYLPFGSPEFQQVWNRTDKLVANGTTSRSFLWGLSLTPPN